MASGPNSTRPATTVRPTRRRVALVAALLGVLAVPAVAPAVSAGPEAVASAAGDLEWEACHQDVSSVTGVAYTCTSLAVPLDHDDSRAGAVDIALVRVAATDPARRIGSLLVNPGGPGGSGVDFTLEFAPFAELVWGPEVPARFDLVGFDPRGIARSAGLRCFDSFDEARAPRPDQAFPTSFDQVRPWRDDLRGLWQACRHHGGPIIDHMSTANTARDLDLIRAAVGDEALTYLGGSYGSYLGVTYANLFPDRVRALVVDGVLDPVRWANVEARVPFSTRLGSDQGAEETLDRMVELCEEAGPPDCALAPDAGGRLDALLAHLRVQPVEYVDPFGNPALVTWPFFTEFLLVSLYDPFIASLAADWAAGLEEVVAGADPAVVAPGPADGPAMAAFADYPNFLEARDGVACSDTANPSSLTRWWSAGLAAEERSPTFGRFWTWASAPCAGWPGRDRDRYIGPWGAATAQPVLVVGNRWDPATPYHGARAVRDQLPNSALVTLEMPAHTALGLTDCVDHAVAGYLVDPGTAPEVDGLVCPLPINPYLLGGLAAGTGGEASAASGTDFDLDAAIRVRASLRAATTGGWVQP